MNKGTIPRRLPVILPPQSDELLSSWISRHACFYAVPPLVMLQHCLSDAPSLREADLHLTDAQGIRIARMFATEPALVRRMTFTNVAQSLHRFIASRPTQSCFICSSDHMTPRPILRSQLLGWRFTCAVCGHLLRDDSGHKRPSPFKQYRGAALRGEKLLDDEAERGTGTWTSPAEIARLLLMRRVPRPFPREHDLWRFRVLGAIVPDFDDVVARQEKNLPSPARPILPLHLRPALLAGVAIVELAGPEMLRMLRGQMMGENRTRFTLAAENMIAHAPKPRASLQMHLI